MVDSKERYVQIIVRAFNFNHRLHPGYYIHNIVYPLRDSDHIYGTHTDFKDKAIFSKMISWH